jgi:hypothetical protein
MPKLTCDSSMVWSVSNVLIVSPQASRKRPLTPLDCLLAFAAICSVGCSDRPDAAQVGGKVLMKDGSVPQGGVRVVQFVPASDSPAEIRKGASGEIKDDGSFVAYTRKPGDGVFLGKYDVTFSVWKSAMDSTSLIDPKFSRASTTPYHVTVEEDIDDLKFELDPAPAGRR